MKYAQIIIFKKAGEFDSPLTYSLPPEAEASCKIGQGVYVPLRNRSVLGIVVDIVSEIPSDIPHAKIKPLKQLTDFYIAPVYIKLAKRISAYYIMSLTRALRLMVPKKIWEGKIDEPKKNNYELQITNYELHNSINSTKQKAVIKALKESSLLSETELIDRSGAGKPIIRALVKKNIIKPVFKPLYHKPDYSLFPFTPLKYKLTQQQENALKKIRKTEKPILIHGVTGSGKTELYLRIILETVRQGKQAVLLVPEIALTPQITDYFRDYFGPHLALFHSKLAEGQRAEEWWKVETGYAPLVIGSRSAVFAPAENLGVIILDEEHEWTYKQETAPYYQTHHVAEILRELTGCRLIFGSATPRAETYYKAFRMDDRVENRIDDQSENPSENPSENQFEYLRLNERINQKPLPAIRIVDLRDEFKQKNFSVLSRALQNGIKERLEKREQVILFVNQRGAARAVVCRDCGYTHQCPNCEVSLKLHHGNKTQNSNDSLVCHYCGYSKPPSIKCPQCQSPYIKHIGVGTQRVEEEVKALFPSARVLRADKDTTSGKAGFEPIYKAFAAKRHDILIGTQMVAKGLDFENVSLIGLILADIGLHIPDFRSHERLFQLITQVSGRCGRGSLEGEVVLQTYQPDNDAIKSAAAYGYDEFIKKELGYREKLGYPPLGRIIKFTVVGTDEERLHQHVQTETEVLEDIFKIENLNFKIVTAPAIVPKVANRYYYNILIRAENPHIIFRHWKVPKYWRIDVDPIHTA